MQALQTPHDRAAEVDQPARQGVGEHRNTDDEIRHDSLRRNGVRIDRRGCLQGKRFHATADFSGCGLVELGIDRRHVVEDREQGRPELDRDQRGRISGQHHQRAAARRQEEEQHDQREDRIAHCLGDVAHDRQGLLGNLGAVDPGGILRSHCCRTTGGQHHA